MTPGQMVSAGSTVTPGQQDCATPGISGGLKALPEVLFPCNSTTWLTVAWEVWMECVPLLFSITPQQSLQMTFKHLLEKNRDRWEEGKPF